MYPVFIVSHRTSKEADEMLQASGLDYAVIPNVGLEFGCYDWYLKSVYSQQSAVGSQGSAILFMHDDLDIRDFGEFDRIAELTYSQSYIFQDEVEDNINQHRHGRMIYLSNRVIENMLSTVCDCKYAHDFIDQEHNPGSVIAGAGPHTGFWFDPYNYGHINGKPPLLFTTHHEHQQSSVPNTIWHYNHGIFHFDRQIGLLKRQGFDVLHKHYAPGLFIGRRNRFRENEGDKYYKVTSELKCQVTKVESELK